MKRFLRSEDKTRKLHKKAMKVQAKSVESTLKLAKMIEQSSESLRKTAPNEAIKMRGKARLLRHTETIDGRHIQVARILEEVDFPVDRDTGVNDISKGLKNLSTTTLQDSTNYVILIVQPGVNGKVSADAGLTIKLSERLRGTGLLHFQDKVDRALKANLNPETKKYPKTIRVVFLGGNLTVDDQDDMEKASTQRSVLKFPDGCISGHNISSRIKIQANPVWAIAGVTCIGAGTYLSRPPETLTILEKKMAKRFNEVYTYKPPNKKVTKKPKKPKKKETA